MQKKENLEVVASQEFMGKRLNVFGTIEEPLFSATEVAGWIENKNPAQMLKPLDEDEKALYTFYRVDGSSNKAWMITENGLYEVLMLSCKTIAKQFKTEIKRILKQIRQTGGYIPVKPEDDEKSIMARGYVIAMQTIGKKDELIKQLVPKAAAFDDLMNADGYFQFIDVAQAIEIGRTKLFDFLRQKKVLTKQSNFNVPYGRFANNGYFKVVVSKRNEHSTSVTLVSPLGLRYIYKLIKKSKLENEFDTEKLLSATVSERTVA